MIVRYTNFNKKFKWLNFKTKSFIKINHYYASTLTKETNKEVQKKLKDVVIVGAGPVGLALACGIVSHIERFGPLSYIPKLSIVDRMPLPNLENESIDKPISNRVVSITPSTMEFLNQCNVSEYLNKEKVFPYQAIQVWDSGKFGQLDFKSENDNMAYMIELDALTKAMLKRLTQVQNKNIELEFYCGEPIDKIEYLKDNEIKKDEIKLDWPTLYLKDQSIPIQSRLIVGADGANSLVRKVSNIESFGWDYDQLGSVATLKLELNNKDKNENQILTAYQRFLPSGPIALLPLGNEQMNLVWSMTPEIAKMIKKLDKKILIQLLNILLRAQFKDIEFLLNQLKNEEFNEEDLNLINLNLNSNSNLPKNLPIIEDIIENKLAFFPLKLRHVERYVLPRIALIGDAAHSTHPLAGQGLNLGLGDANSLSKSIIKGFETGSDIGSIHILENYPKERYLYNLIMLSSTDKLYRLFKSNINLIQLIRGFGMDFFNMSFIKNYFIKFAKGW